MASKTINQLWVTIILLILLTFSNSLTKEESQNILEVSVEAGIIKTDSELNDSLEKPKPKKHPDVVKFNPKEETDKEKLDTSECDLVSDGPICLFNGDRVILPHAKLPGLVGYWNFDESKPTDNSGNRNHGLNMVNPGPAFAGSGSSAHFQSGEYLEIPYNEKFNSQDFTITFWVFIIQDFFTSSKGIRFCPLIQRGKDDLFSKKFERNPALYIDRQGKNLKFIIKTSDEKEAEGETLTSNAKVTNQRWLHISMVKQGAKLKLYVNGILDSSITLKSEIEKNESSLFIGNVPWLKEECDFPFLIDELRYYSIAVDEDKIQAEASPILGGVEPSFLQLGCVDCLLSDASSICQEGYRLCTSIELHTAGYQIARSLGWLNWNTHIWTHGAMKTPGDFANLKGLALCCAELQ